MDVTLEVAGVGTLTVDTAWGGDSFVVVDAKTLGFEIEPHEARDIVEMAMRITAAATNNWTLNTRRMRGATFPSANSQTRWKLKMRF